MKVKCKYQQMKSLDVDCHQKNTVNMKPVDVSLTVFISGVVVLEMLGELVVGNSFGWLLGELVGEFIGLLLGEIFVTGSSCFANMVVLATMEVLDVLVVTGSSCLINMTTTPMRVCPMPPRIPIPTMQPQSS